LSSAARKGGKTLAVDLRNHGAKTALIERDASMTDGGRLVW
jgi:hypothetical protein